MRLSASVLFALFSLPALTCVCVASDNSESKVTTITGRVNFGSLDSSIMASEENIFEFATDSPDAKIVFSACQVDDICKVSYVTRSDGSQRVKEASLVLKGNLN